jgi:CrcB protein
MHGARSRRRATEAEVPGVSDALRGLTNVALVGTGGFIGSTLRYVVSLLAVRLWPNQTLPIATLGVNVAGCLAIGFLAGVSDTRQAVGHGMRLFLIVGVLGGFTTFSTFGFETFALFREGETARALLNLCLNATTTIGAVAAGYAVARVL